MNDSKLKEQEAIYINVYIYTLHIPQKCVQFAHALSLPPVQPFLSWIGIRKETSNVEKDEAVIFFSVPSYNYYSSYSSQYGNTYFAGVLQNGLPTIGKPTVETSWNFLGKHRPMDRAAPSAASAVKRAHKMRAPAVRKWRCHLERGVTQTTTARWPKMWCTPKKTSANGSK